MRHLKNKLHFLDYPHALNLGLPIASGRIASGHREVLHSLLKKAGTAWRYDHTDQIGPLGVLRPNNQYSS